MSKEIEVLSKKKPLTLMSLTLPIASLSPLDPSLYLNGDRGEVRDAPRGARRCNGNLRPCTVVANRARQRAENFMATRTTVKRWWPEREEKGKKVKGVCALPPPLLLMLCRQGLNNETQRLTAGQLRAAAARKTPSGLKGDAG